MIFGVFLQNSSTVAVYRPFCRQLARQCLTFNIHPSRKTHSLRHAGFSLIEILIVIAVIAIASLMVRAKLFPTDAETLQAHTERLVMRLELARDEAALGGRAIRVAVRPDGVTFFSRDPANPARWVTASGESFTPLTFPQPIELRLQNSGQTASAARAAELVFLPAGVAEPLSLELFSPAGAWQIGVNAIGHFTVKRNP